jgi:F420H(2)-dependent quinone reductase
MQKLILNWVLSVAVFLYRVTGGRVGGSMSGVLVLLLTTTGRKSGKERTVPLVYIRDGAAYVVTASAGGSDKHPGWFFNVSSNPNVTIQVKDQQIRAKAEVASPQKKSELWPQLLKVAPNFASYQRHTSRDIPMVILRPA